MCKLKNFFTFLPTANCQLPTANCQLPTANCQLPTANCQLQPPTRSRCRGETTCGRPRNHWLIGECECGVVSPRSRRAIARSSSGHHRPPEPVDGKHVQFVCVGVRPSPRGEYDPGD